MNENPEFLHWWSILARQSWAYGNVIGQTTTLPLSLGGLGVSTGISGGVLGFTSTNTLSSSALLTQYGIVLGGGVGATPTSLSTSGASTEVLHGNSSIPYYGPVILTADVSGILPLVNGGTNASTAADARASLGLSAVTTIQAAHSPYTVSATDRLIRCNTSSGTITVLMPHASTKVREIFVKKIDNSVSTVTISSIASDTFDGQVTTALASQYAVKSFINGTSTNWDRLNVNTL